MVGSPMTALVIWFALTIFAFAQPSTNSNPSSDEEKRIQELRALTALGPIDHKSHNLRFHVLTEMSIIRELGITSEQRAALEEANTRLKQLSAEFMQNRKGRSLEQNKVQFSDLRKKSDEIFESSLSQVLTKDQSFRLGQLGYHIEIAYYGFEQAWLSGTLGVDLGLSDQQKLEMANFSKLAADSLVKGEGQLTEQLYSDIYTELSVEQRSKASKLLGKPLAYEDDLVIRHRNSIDDESSGILSNQGEQPRKKYVPDMSNLSNLFENLRISTMMQDELQLNYQQLAACNKVKEDVRRSMSEARRESIQLDPSKRKDYLSSLPRRISAQVEGAATEIITPSQLERLKQIGYFVEIAYAGLPEAITTGRLGSDIGITENQADSLRPKVQRMCKVYETGLESLRKETFDKIVSHLPPEIFERAKQIVGPYFRYSSDSVYASNKSRRDAARELAELGVNR